MGRGYGHKNSVVTRAKENLVVKFRDVMPHFGTKNSIHIIGTYIREPVSGRVVPVLHGNWLATFSLRRNFGNRRSDFDAVGASRHPRRRSSIDWCSSSFRCTHPHIRDVNRP